MTLILIALSGCKKAEPAEFVFTGGTIHLDTSSTTTALAVSGGLIVALGEEALALDGDGTRAIELGGAHLVHGFTDAHVHLLPGSFVLDRLLIMGASSMDSVLSSVARYAEDTPEEPWIVGYGWQSSLFDEEPIGVAMDDLGLERPVLLVDNSGHSALVNSIALAAAGIDASTPDPPGGEIMRDEDGEPTGWLKEEALSLVSEAALADYSDEAIGGGVASTLDEFSQSGLTGIADIMASPGFDAARPWIYADMEAAGELKLRIHYYTPVTSVADVARAAEYRGEYDGDLVRFAGGKLWVDGSMGTVEAWTTEPHLDDPEDYGSRYFDVETLTEIVFEAERLEISLKVHANGDAAVGAMLDALDAVDAAQSLRQQYTLEHAVLLSEGDRARMAALGVAVSVQPTHALVGGAGDAPDLWGDERYAQAYDFTAFGEAGIPIAMGTDWPVWPSADPLVGVWAGTQADHPLTTAEGVAAYTVGVAQSVDDPRIDGILAVGSLADFVVFDQDPLAIDPNELTGVQVVDVYLAGEAQ